MKRKDANKETFFTRDKYFYRSFFRLTSIVAMQNVVLCTVGLAGNIIIGRYSEYAMSGVALANQVQFLLQMILGGIVEGMLVIASQYWGAKRIDPIHKAIAISIRLAASIALGFTLACALFPAKILSVYTSDPLVILMGAEYMRIACASYIFLCLSGVLIGAALSVENPTVGVVSSVTGLTVSVALHYALIFGKFGFPELGVRGAAIATVIGRAAEFFVAVAFMLKREKKLNLTIKALLGFDVTMLKDYLRIVLPTILAGGSWGIAMSIQASIIGFLGSAAISANAIALSLVQVISVYAYAAGSAAGVLTGKIIGSGNRDGLRGRVRAMQALFFGIGIATGAALFLVKNLVLRSYNISEASLTLANQFILVLCVTIVGSAYQSPCLTGIVRGGGNTRFVFYNDLIFMWGLALPFAALSAFVWKLSPVIVFFILKSDQIAKCFVALWQVNSYRWVRPVTEHKFIQHNDKKYVASL